MARFLVANIESVVQLEILRVLAGEREKEWVAADLAPAVQAQPQTTARDLAALERRGLVTAAPPPGLRYRYGPRDPELGEKVRRLLQLYNERPVTMIRMIYALADTTFTRLADALRTRHEG